MRKIDPINKDILNRAEIIKNELDLLADEVNKRISCLDLLADEVNKRISYIAKFICKTCKAAISNQELYSFNVPLLLNQRKCNGDDVFFGPSLTGCIVCLFNDPNFEWDFEEGDYPVRWLFEDFEEEITNGYLLYKEKCANIKKADKDKIKDIKKKLTKEEIDFLISNDKFGKLTFEEIFK